jgi:flagella basal body P-ring formation protein FlgA
VSRQARAARQLLRADDLSLEERDVAPLGATPLGSDVDISARRLRRALAVNRIVLRGAVEDVPPISQGEDVAVRVQSGAVEIQTRAVALQDGRLGELVKLENPTSHATFTAHVIGAQQALVNTP